MQCPFVVYHPRQQQPVGYRSRAKPRGMTDKGNQTRSPQGSEGKQQMENKGSAAPECLLQAGKGLRLGAPHPCPTSQQTCREQTLLALELPSFPAPGLVGTSCQTGWTEHHEAPGMDIENLVPRVHPGTTIPTALHSPCECCPALTSLHPSTAGARRGWHGPDLEKLEVGAKEHKLGPPHLRAVPSRLQNTSTALQAGAAWILGPRALPAASSASPQNASPLLMQHRVGPSHA